MSFMLKILDGNALELVSLAEDRPLFIGRGQDADIVLEDDQISRKHCRMEKTGDKFVLEDLESTNGTFLKGKQIQKVELINGDEVSVGMYVLQFIDAHPQEVNENAEEAERMFVPVARSTYGPQGRKWDIAVSGGRLDTTITFNKLDCLIGRSAHCDIKLEGKNVSLNHVLLVKDRDKIIILNVSDNNDEIAVNGEFAEKQTVINSAAELAIGSDILTLTPAD